MITIHHATITTPMIHALFLSHAFILLCFTFVCLSPSLQLTWLTDTALVTLVYPNQMQYTPCILQEASLLDGVDASVCGNGRRFYKTSSYPLSHQYVSLYYLIIPNQPAVAGQLNVIRPQWPTATL